MHISELSNGKVLYMALVQSTVGSKIMPSNHITVVVQRQDCNCIADAWNFKDFYEIWDIKIMGTTRSRRGPAQVVEWATWGSTASIL